MVDVSNNATTTEEPTMANRTQAQIRNANGRGRVIGTVRWDANKDAYEVCHFPIGRPPVHLGTVYSYERGVELLRTVED